MKRRPGALARANRLCSELTILIEDLLEEPVAAQNQWQPRLDLIDHDDHLTVRVELPGVASGEVRLELSGSTLSIRGNKQRSPSEPPARRFHLMERYIGVFELILELPVAVLPASSSARLENGLLNITLHKVSDQRSRCYPIIVDEESPDHD